MNIKVRETMEQFHMIKQGERVIVGFSGGADSVALLSLLYKEKEERGINLSAVHLNHLLRGTESDRDEEFCRAFCQERGIPFVAQRLDIKELATKSGRSIEEEARYQRYLLFDKSGMDGKIATAHTLSDSLETVLLNLTRGTGLDGLTGIPPVRGRVIRPLILVTRQEVEDYCKREELSYCTDSSNLTTDYTRNKIRLQVVPLLKEINPMVEESVGRMTELLRMDRRYLLGKTVEEHAAIAEKGGVSRSGLLRQPPAIRGRILRQMLEDKGLDVSRQRILEMEKAVAERCGGMQLSPSLRLLCDDNWFGILPCEEEKTKNPYFEKEIILQKSSERMDIPVFEGKTMAFRWVECKEIENIANSFPNRLKNLLDCDKMNPVVKIRGRKEGDRFSPTGRGWTKTLKKLFNEEKVPLEERSRRVIIEDAGEILWVEGLGASDRVAATTDTIKALDITLL